MALLIQAKAEALPLPDECADAFVTDPPYGLEFMGRSWDKHETPLAFQQWCQEWGTEAMRVLKPGGWLVAFGGTRTYHRLASGLEDAGFEIRDSLHWLYSTGFPKSLNVCKALAKSGGLDAERWQGWGTALKPSHEPIVLARKPLSGTVAGNVLEWGTGALHIDACRVGTDEQLGRTNHMTSKFIDSANGSREAHARTVHVDNSTGKGRWPPNTLLSHSPGCDGTCAPGCPVALLDTQSGTRKSGKAGPNGHQRAATLHDTAAGWRMRHEQDAGQLYGDQGGASRFFPQLGWSELDEPAFQYVAKASRRERDLGLPDGMRNTHPTVKPVALMQWLVRLVTPPGGVVLDPFCGSGTTGVACVREGFRFVGVDSGAEPASLPSARARLAHAGTVGPVPAPLRVPRARKPRKVREKAPIAGVEQLELAL